jgi:dephospho-CoA kinase
MLRIGLTGGIGSGKSTVCRVFETLGIPVYYADDAAKKLMNTNDELKKSIITHFGKESYNNEGLNRKYLASIVFNNKEKLDLLNSLTHPITIIDAQNWIKSQKSPYIIKEAALLFESGAAENLNYIIGVFAPENLRIKRVVKRDHLTVDDVMKRINRQIEEDIKMKLCDFIISNDEQELVIPQVLELDKKFRIMADN